MLPSALRIQARLVALPSARVLVAYGDSSPQAVSAHAVTVVNACALRSGTPNSAPPTSLRCAPSRWSATFSRLLQPPWEQYAMTHIPLLIVVRPVAAKARIPRIGTARETDTMAGERRELLSVDDRTRMGMAQGGPLRLLQRYSPAER